MRMRRTAKLVLSAMFTANALTLFILEAQLPPLAPIPGIKLGLANVVTLAVIFLLGSRAGIAVHLLRIVLGTLFTGQAVSFLYSLSGGLCCLLIMLLTVRPLGKHLLWLSSILAAIAHIGGQLAVAVWVLGTVSILLYLPVLLISSILTGLFTGLCVQTIVCRYPALLRLLF